MSLASSFDETSRLWKSRFSENYISCGCNSSQPTLPPSSKLKFWKKTSDSSKSDDTRPTPAATHPTDHNSILTVNPKRAVEESRRSRAASIARNDNSGHPQAFLADYLGVDANQYSAFGMAGWDIDCVRQPFAVNAKQDRGDCCVVSACCLTFSIACKHSQGVHISCSTISNMSATGEGAVGSRMPASEFHKQLSVRLV
jgi:hypothetical protein